MHLKNLVLNLVPALVPKFSSKCRHLQLPLLLKPTGGVRKRGCPPGHITQYDPEIIHYNNLQYLPGQITKLLCQEHGLDSDMMNQKSVERRLWTIKAKGLAKLAPVNEDVDLLARDTAKKCKLFFLHIFY